MPTGNVGGTADDRVMIGLGANIGEPVEQIAHAVMRLGEHFQLDATSSLYRSEPVGFVGQPIFYNAVVAGRTVLSPFDLLARCMDVEAELGRTRAARFGPRTIDIDLLAIGDDVIRTPRLTLPHPRLHERAFVLVPLAEVAPRWRHPVIGLTAEELLRRLPASSGWVESAGALRVEPDRTPLPTPGRELRWRLR